MNPAADHELLLQIDRLAPRLRTPQSVPAWDELLGLVLTHFTCPVGSVHVLDPRDGLLHIRAARGIPDAIRPQVERIPVGKGMAGLAAERRAPVGACNLQTDRSGDVRPGAKLTAMKGSLCVPMLDGSELRGTFGVARPDEHDFDERETNLLLAVGERVARVLPATG